MTTNKRKPPARRRAKIKNLNPAKLQHLLKNLRACVEARRWAKGKSLKQAWKVCSNPDWLLWFAWAMRGLEGWPLGVLVERAHHVASYSRKTPKTSEARAKIVKSILKVNL